MTDQTRTQAIAWGVILAIVAGSIVLYLISSPLSQDFSEKESARLAATQTPEPTSAPIAAIEGQAAMETQGPVMNQDEQKMVQAATPAPTLPPVVTPSATPKPVAPSAQTGPAFGIAFLAMLATMVIGGGAALSRTIARSDAF